jgi:hypothetical protein
MFAGAGYAGLFCVLLLFAFLILRAIASVLPENPNAELHLPGSATIEVTETA